METGRTDCLPQMKQEVRVNPPSNLLADICFLERNRREVVLYDILVVERAVTGNLGGYRGGWVHHEGEGWRSDRVDGRLLEDDKMDYWPGVAWSRMTTSAAPYRDSTD